MAARDHFRAFARRPVHLSATIVSTNSAWQESARVIDLGLGGACLELAEALSHGTRVQLQLVAPHLWDPLLLEAQIAWTRDAVGAAFARVGVRFEHSSGKTLRSIAELLETDNYD